MKFGHEDKVGRGESVAHLIQVVPPELHSMGKTLVRYVEQRVDVQALEIAVARDARILVQSVSPEMLAKMAITEREQGGGAHPIKWANRIRSVYVNAPSSVSPPTLRVFVPAGLDYTVHIAELIQFQLGTRRELSDVTYFSEYEHRIASCLDFLQGKIEEIVVLGNSELMIPYLVEGGAVLNSLEEDGLYRAYRMRFHGIYFTLLSVRYSFWGSVAGILSSAIIRAGCRHLVYVGKLGSLTDAPLYQKTFVPNAFYNLGHNGEIATIAAPRNPLLEWNGDLATGSHLSVPTMMRETKELITGALRAGFATVDNEVSVMAHAISAISTDLGFTALHYATDHPRSVEDRSSFSSDLTTGREISERSLRATALSRISHLLTSYIGEL
ncbi:hypothetical protein [Microbacterium sp. RURRCA19A]|uniref:hypothetical protein n=1 Tax=Microbacterium sp. RURRCA19A TaxID=1907391 RepID=UPI000955537A|nr:hypothetical protein [Microbacterium sp. RURRCA19A]SIS10684.1 hypothetical protein SAMN05880568_2808 [Microbacterium sp. RURRCA19A]